MNAYTPVSLANSDISTLLQRHKVLQLFSQLKTVIFDTSSQLGGQNIPELDSQTSLVDLKIDFAEIRKSCEILRKLVSVCFRMVKKKDSIHIRERNILRMVDFTENDIFHAETEEQAF